MQSNYEQWFQQFEYLIMAILFVPLLEICKNLVHPRGYKFLEAIFFNKKICIKFIFILIIKEIHFFSLPKFFPRKFHLKSQFYNFFRIRKTLSGFPILKFLADTAKLFFHWMGFYHRYIIIQFIYKY